MASLVLGVVGAGVGSMFGQAALGYTLGSALGGMFGSKPKGQDITMEGPRINDLKVMSSTYGAPIPITYGSVRIAGNMIWTTGLIETKHVTTQESGGGGGGKGGIMGGGGGGESTQTTITYTYAASFAMALCEGPIMGIRRIWADGTLIYDLSGTSDPQAVYKSNSIASANKIYFGDQTQLPDPTMQAYLGADNVPAYRGIAYIVFDTLQLADYGNRIPNLEFEVLNEAIVTGGRILTSRSNTGIQFARTSSGGGGGYVAGVGRPAALGFDGTMRITTLGNDTVYLFNPNGDYIGKDERSDAELYPIINEVMSGSYPVGQINGYYVSVCNLAQPIGYGLSVPAYAYFPTAMGGTELEVTDDLAQPLPQNEYVGGLGMSTNNTHCIIFTAPSNPLAGFANINKYYIVEYAGGSPVLISQGVTPPLSISDLGFGNNATYGFISCCLEENLKYFWTIDGARTNDAKIYVIQANGVMVLADTVSQVWPTTGVFSYPTIFARNGIAYAFGYNQSSVLTRIESATVTTSTLSSVVTDIITRGALDVSDFDVTTLAGYNVGGYFIGSQMTIRAALQPLQTSHWFDATETDGKIKFIPRGGESIVNIGSEELSAYNYGGSVPDPITTVRTQELELPRRVSIKYMNIAQSFQQAEQYAARLITKSEQVSSQQLAMSLTDQEAADIASVLLYAAWMERNHRTLTLNMKYAYLDPCDIIQVDTEDTTYNLRIIQTNYGQNGIVQLTTVDDDAAVYTPNNVPEAAEDTSQSLTLPGPTRLALMDIPMLRDQDNNAGFYWAASGYLDSWRGTALFKSTDGGATYSNAGSSIVPATIGYATTVLGNWTGGNIFDETNTVTVFLISGELFSDTLDNVLNGHNTAVLGSEIIQYKTATQIADKTYTLSGLLRGRKGTEWAMSTHAVDERFVLAEVTTWQRYAPNLSEVGLSRTWKAATIGTTLGEALPQTFTANAIALKPFSPVNIGGGRDGSGNITITWQRRGRIGGAWMNNVEVPIGESSESYSIDIMDGILVKRTLTSLTPTVSYTAAQQITDWGILKTSVTVNVYQISGSIGRGYAGVATI